MDEHWDNPGEYTSADPRPRQNTDKQGTVFAVAGAYKYGGPAMMVSALRKAALTKARRMANIGRLVHRADLHSIRARVGVPRRGRYGILGVEMRSCWCRRGAILGLDHVCHCPRWACWKCELQTGRQLTIAHSGRVTGRQSHHGNDESGIRL